MVSKKWQPGDTGNSGVAFPKIHYLNANFICQEGKNNFYASSDHMNYTVKVKVLVVNMCPVSSTTTEWLKQSKFLTFYALGLISYRKISEHCSLFISISVLATFLREVSKFPDHSLYVKHF